VQHREKHRAFNAKPGSKARRTLAVLSLGSIRQMLRDAWRFEELQAQRPAEAALRWLAV
jgi:hypothetical protein